MIRQITHIAIAALLLISTTGFTVHKHYCMGNLVETSILHEPDYCCGEGADCCKNVIETYQLDEDFDLLIQIIDFQNIEIILPEIKPLFIAHLEVQADPLGSYKVLHPPDLGTVLARLQVFCL